MQYSKFVVDETPWCAWEWDLKKQNLAFVEGVDPTYFEFLARAYVNSLDIDQDHKAALALRTTYSHGVETFFAFLFAAIQAPDCVIGWVHKYYIHDLKNLLEKVSHGESINTKIDIAPITWKNIANAVLIFTLGDKEKEKRIKQKFAVAWQKLANDFLEPSFTPEYNSIKHGFRAKSGGSRVAMVRENQPGISASPENMHLWGESEYGSKFFTVEPLDQSKHNFRLLKHYRGWQLENFYFGLNLISLSLQNVLSFLKVANGVDPSNVEFAWPSPESLFDEPWKKYPSSSGISMNSVITVEQITPFSDDEILSIYKIDGEEK